MEFIGSRISLISKRDIRYVGTLHEISSENSTVALEQVVSYGTEGRRTDDVVPPSDNVYEYIVFRGSDVKDLRIEQGPNEQPPKPPQVPDDPAILGNSRRPNSTTSKPPQAAPAAESQTELPASNAPSSQSQLQQRQAPPPMDQGFQRGPPPPQGFPPQQGPYGYPMPPHNQRYGPQGYPQGPPPGPGYPGMPYGAPPPGWYPPPYGFPPQGPPGQFQPGQMPGGPSPQQFRGAVQPPQNVPTPTGSAKPAKEESNALRASVSPPEAATVKLPSAPTGSAATKNAQAAPPPPSESKPDVAEALAPPAQPSSSTNNAAATKAPPSGPKSGRIMPAVPFASANKNQMPTAPAAQGKAAPATQVTKDEPAANKSIEEANRDARAAVAAAMAKLNNSGAARKAPETTGAMDNLTKKVNEMRTNDGVPRAPRNPGAAPRGSRGGPRHPARKMEVPKTDYDFETANAKFNKQDLVKEVIATGSPLASPAEGATPNAGVLEDAANGHKGGESTVVIPTAPGYNKSSSFFDDISSEIKDRAERAEGNAQGGDFRQFRNEERQKNLETFGQGSVDNGFRRGYGRGRGRGFGGRGRGRGGGGRGGVQGVVAEN